MGFNVSFMANQSETDEDINNIGYNLANTVYNGEIITTPYMSTTGELSNGATVVYVLDNPIEIPLTEEQISAYKVLQTYKPTTIITNDEDAYMKVNYVADTKNYIDNKFAELQNAILSTGGNI